MLKNPLIKNVLSSLAIAGFGFLLLNVAFIFDWLLQSLIIRLIRYFTPVDFQANFQWFPPVMQGVFVIVIGIISWFVFKSKFGTLYKAIYMTVPLAVVLVISGILLYRWPIAVYSFGTLFTFGLLYYFYRTKKPWLYYYTVLLVSTTLLIFTLSGGEI